jgi:integrase/recombinase XerC
MEKLFTEVQYPEGYEGVLEKTILIAFYVTGMRLSELVGLKTQAVDFSYKTIKVLGKGNKERIIPMGSFLKEHLSQYENHKNQLPQFDSTYFFVSSKGTPLYHKQVYLIVKKYLQTVSTISKKSPHVLRHTFATHLTNGGAELNAVKDLLGHASLAATQVYTHNSIEKLKEIFNKAHPKA